LDSHSLSLHTYLPTLWVRSSTQAARGALAPISNAPLLAWQPGSLAPTLALADVVARCAVAATVYDEWCLVEAWCRMYGLWLLVYAVCCMLHSMLLTV